MSISRRILLAAMGGTIAAEVDADGRHSVANGAEQLATELAQITQMAEVITVDVCRLPSHAIGPSEHLTLVQVIAAWVARGIDGIVVTHGTDTIEETAYSLALQIHPSIPIVLTGAMRSPDSPGADGIANLVAAVRVALTPAARSLGPVVVVQDEIHLARWVTKASTGRVGAFASPGFGPIGEVIEGVVRIVVVPSSNDYIGAPETLDKKVDVVWATAGADGFLIDAAASRADGLVVAGTGGGHLPDGMAEAAVGAVERGIPVVLASRTGSGCVLRATYGDSPGSETELIRRGLIPAGSLSPTKARLRLMTSLALGIPAASVFPV